MNRDPSLIPRLCETQWRHIFCPINCVITRLPPLDCTLHMMTFRFFVTYNVPFILPSTQCCLSSTGCSLIWENWYFLGKLHDPMDNVKENFTINSHLCCSTWALNFAALTRNQCFCCFHCSFWCYYLVSLLALHLCFVSVTASAAS